MALQSMTGFARVEGHNEFANWIWEVRSVNGKGLDFRLRQPSSIEDLQPKVRKLVSEKFSRGNLQISLDVDRPGSQAVPVVNQAALDAVVAAVQKLQNELDCPTPAAEQLLAIKGVLELREADNNDEDETALATAIMNDFDKLLKELFKARTDEGIAVTRFLHGQIAAIEKLTLAIGEDPSRTTDQIKARLNKQISQLMDNTVGLDLDRLHQEAVILAAKADICEELDRLEAHIDQARKLFAGEGPVGRKLDFLCQEFNRECNTICSKSNAVTVTAADLK